ncbi:MAG: MFS transporter [Candidatus Omnitrophica bacterium]|nr:MFS transporter [Candidatus Omnitrophota bacterium]
MKFNSFAFSALRHRNFRIFWLGQFLSLCGSWMQNVAQGWLVLSVTNSVFLLGLTGAIAGLPVLVFSLVGGVTADRVNKRSFLILTQALAALLALILAILISLKIVTFWQIALIAGLSGLVLAFDAPVRQSFFAELVPKKDLSNAIAINSTVFNITRIIGPVLAAFAIAGLGMSSAFYLNSLSFLPAIIALYFIRGNFRPQHKPERTIISSLFQGAGYIWKNRRIRILIIHISFLSVFGMSGQILMPVFARDILHLGVRGLGHLMAFFGLGSLIGAIFMVLSSHFPRRERFVFIGGLVMSLSLILFALSQNTTLSCLLLIPAGWGFITQAVTIQSLLQNYAPDALRGRVMGFFTFTFMGMMPIGSFQAGLLAHLWGTPAAVVIGGIICLGASLYLLLNSRLLSGVVE